MRKLKVLDAAAPSKPRDVADLQRRIREAMGQLAQLPNVQFDPGAFQFSSDLEAIKRLLIENGLTGQIDLMERSLEVQAERLETALRQAKAPKLYTARA